jgi:hypothetical protein
LPRCKRSKPIAGLSWQPNTVYASHVDCCALLIT